MRGCRADQAQETLFGKGQILPPESAAIGPINRRDFLKLGGVGLAGATLLGVAGCGGGEQIGGGGSQGAGGGNTFIYGRGRRLGLAGSRQRHGRRVLRRHAPDLRQLLDFEPGSYDPIPSLATEIPQPEHGRASYTIDAAGGRQVPRRVGLQRRGRELQLRPLAPTEQRVPHGRRQSEPRTSPTTALAVRRLRRRLHHRERRGGGRVHRALRPHRAARAVPAEPGDERVRHRLARRR